MKGPIPLDSAPMPTCHISCSNLVADCAEYSGSAELHLQLWALRVVIGRSGRKGAFKSPSLIRKRNQTNQLQTKLLTSGPGGRRFKSSLPDQFLQAVRAISAPAVLGAMGATGNFGATVGMWKPSPACSAVNLRNSTSSFTFE